MSWVSESGTCFRASAWNSDTLDIYSLMVLMFFCSDAALSYYGSYYSAAAAYIYYSLYFLFILAAEISSFSLASSMIGGSCFCWAEDANNEI